MQKVDTMQLRAEAMVSRFSIAIDTFLQLPFHVLVIFCIPIITRPETQFGSY
jgi:hypothetical protein